MFTHAPDLTAQCFISNPFGPGMAYRAGNLCRRDKHGDYYFLQRIDGQVEIAGFRIELAEVELACASHPDVDQAVAVVKNDRLAMFVKLRSTSAEMRSRCMRQLQRTRRRR
jgi:acyl-coenzyme A synthetase/AMP-(fatty) acid ligase